MLTNFKIKKILFLAFLPLMLFANPKGEKVKVGNATFSRVGDKLIITQGSNHTIIHWDDFSIKAKELTKFIQPSKDASVLNRVTGSFPSSIQGALKANGKVFLINQNGILIGPKGMIETRQFIASTLNVEDKAFLSGDAIHFSGDSAEKIINEGTIKAIDGDVFIFAREIENKGTIEAKENHVGLAASNDILLMESGNQRVAINTKTQGKVTNTGKIQAAIAELKASGGNIYALAINQEGIIDASSAVSKNGEIYLHAKQGEVSVTGTLNVSQLENDKAGGRIEVLGDSITLDGNAHLNASGNSGGGTILLGGDYQGKNPDIKNANNLSIGKDVQMQANALIQGDGGKVIIWADEATHFFGSVFAKGGEILGDGGFVEVSAKHDLRYKGVVDTSAPMGSVGTLLLDPSNINITNTSPTTSGFTNPYDPAVHTANLYVNDLTNALASSNVIVQTSNGIGGQGNITVQTPINWVASTKLTLKANRSLIISSDIQNTYSGTTDFTAMDFQGGLTTSAVSYHGIYIFNGATVSTTTGSITMTGTSGYSQRDAGIYITDGATVKSINTTTTYTNGISMTGTGSNLATNGEIYGCWINGSDTTVQTTNTTSGSASLQITGTINGSGDSNYGVLIDDNAIVSVNNKSGTTQINGTSGPLTVNTNYGVAINENAQIRFENTSSATITGTCNSTGNNNYGVLLDGGTIRELSSSNISITGTGNYGIGIGKVLGSLLDLDSSSTFTLSGVGTLANSGIVVTSSSQVGTNSNQTMTLAADNFNYGGTFSTNLNGSFLFRPRSSNKSIGIGTGSAGDVVFSDNDVSKITASTVLGTTIFSTNNTGNTNNIINVDAITFNSKVELKGKNIIFNGAITTSDTLVVQGTASPNTLTLSDGAEHSWNITGSNSGNVGAISSFTNFQNLTGGAGVDTLTGPASPLSGSNINWTITGTNAGNISGGITFTNMNNLTGSSLNWPDIFTFQVGGKLTGTTGINGNIGSNKIIGPNEATTWTLTGANAGNINPASADATNFQNIQTLEGGSGTDTLIGVTGGSSWTVSGTNAGSITNSVTFTSMNYLRGGATGNDTFTFSDGASIDGTLNGGSSSGNTMNLEAYTTSVDVDLSANTATGTGGFSNIQSFVAGTGSNTFTAENSNNTWNITSTNLGNVGGYSFTNFQNLTGKTLTDNFIFSSSGAKVTGTINGGVGGTNTLNYTNYLANITVDFATTSNTTAVGGFSNINNIIGSNPLLFTNTIVGPNAINTWTLTGNFAGQFTALSGVVFSNFNVIQGGTSTDTLQGKAAGSTWTITGESRGNITDSISFTNIENLTGGAGNDTFTFNIGGSIDGGAGIIDGNGGTNTINGPDENTTWQLTDATAGYFNPASASSTSFTDIQVINGGSSIDIFSPSESNQFTGTIHGNAGDNKLNYSGYSPATNITVNFATGSATKISAFDGIQWVVACPKKNTLTGASSGTNTFEFQTAPDTSTVTGGGGSSTNTIYMNKINTTWNINSTNGGTIGNITFSGIQNLKGGAGADTFSFANGVGVSGSVDGNSFSGNELDYALYTTDVSFDLGASTATNIGSFQNIQTFTAGSGSNNAIYGGDGTNSWNVNSSTTGTINIFSYANISNLHGGNGSDTFTLQASGITATINGQGGTNTLAGFNEPQTWYITENNGGTVGSVTFSHMQRLIGGSAADIFRLSNDKGIQNLINGNSSSGNTLDYSLYTSSVHVFPGKGVSTNVGHYENIQIFILPSHARVLNNEHIFTEMLEMTLGTMASNMLLHPDSPYEIFRYAPYRPNPLRQTGRSFYHKLQNVITNVESIFLNPDQIPPVIMPELIPPTTTQKPTQEEMRAPAIDEKDLVPSIPSSASIIPNGSSTEEMQKTMEEKNFEVSPTLNQTIEDMPMIDEADLNR